MFGYLKPHLKTFPKNLRQQYRQIYCSTCRSLKFFHGIRGCTTLNFEVTFINLIAMALRADEPPCATFTCPATPLKVIRGIDYTDHYLSRSCDISLMLTYHQLADNSADTKKKIWPLLMKLYKNRDSAAKENLGFFSSILDDAFASFNTKEAAKATINELSDLIGLIYQESAEAICHFRGKSFFDDFSSMMYSIGNWIYLIDAVDDYEDDLKSGSFNPITCSDDLSCAIDELHRFHREAVAAFSKLPLIRYHQLLDGIMNVSMVSTMDSVCSKYN